MVGLGLAGAAPARATAFPAPTGFVVDQAGVLAPGLRLQVEAQLADYSRRTTNQVAVAVVRSLDGASVEDYAHDLFASWGIGLRGKDNGVLLLIAVTDRKDRIEVGRGLESELTDLQAGEILRSAVTPAAAQGDFGAAVEQGERQIRRALGDPEADAAAPAAVPLTGDPYGGGLPGRPASGGHRLPAGFVLVVLLLLAGFARRRFAGPLGRRGPGLGSSFGSGLLFGSLMSAGRGGWSGGGGYDGGGGGGFGGFGGGGSGGGGASGGW